MQQRRWDEWSAKMFYKTLPGWMVYLSLECGEQNWPRDRVSTWPCFHVTARLCAQLQSENMSFRVWYVILASCSVVFLFAPCSRLRKKLLIFFGAGITKKKKLTKAAIFWAIRCRVYRGYIIGTFYAAEWELTCFCVCCCYSAPRLAARDWGGEV